MKSDHTYLCAVLCILFTSSVFISDVTARATNSHNSNGYSTHQSHKSTNSYDKRHVSVDKNRGKNQVHSYPSSPGHKLSGNSGTIPKQTNSGHNNPTNHRKNQASTYPSSPEHNLSGNAGGSHRPDKHIYKNNGKTTPIYQTTQKPTHGNRHYEHNSSNILPGSRQKPASSTSRFETTIAPKYIYSSAQKPSHTTQSTYTSNHGIVQNSPLKNETVSGSTNAKYPVYRPGTRSGTGSTSSTYGNPSSNINQSSVFNQRQISAQYYLPNLAAKNHSVSTLYPNPGPGSLSGSGSNLSDYGHPSSNVQTNRNITQLGSTNKVNSKNVTFHPMASPGTTSGGGSSPGDQLYSTPRSGFTSGSGISPLGNGNPSINLHTNNVSQFGFTQQPFINTNASNGSALYSVPRTGGSNSGGKPIVVVSQTIPNGGSSYPKSNYTSSNTFQGPSWGTNTPHHHTPHQKVYHYQNKHHNYVYKPLTVIHYGTYHEKPISFPVYPNVPPEYVFDYQSSDNKYKHLLTGLALYNLGRSSANTNSNNFYKAYKPQPDELCTFGVKYRSGYDEEMEIKCQTITYFIYEDQPLMLTYLTKDINNNTWPMTQLMYSNGSLMEPKNVNNQNNLVNSQALSNLPSSVLSQNDKALLNQMLSTNAQQAQQIISQNGLQDTSSGQQMMLANNGQITSNNQQQFTLASNGQVIHNMQQQNNQPYSNLPSNRFSDNNRAIDRLLATNSQQAQQIFSDNGHQTLNNIGQQNFANGANDNNMQQSVPYTSTTYTNKVRSITDPQLSGNLVVIEKYMECYVTRKTRSSNMKKSVPCDLLKKYSTSIRNSGGMLQSSLFVVLVTFIFVFSY